jgi:hypothetical protein
MKTLTLRILVLFSSLPLLFPFPAPPVQAAPAAASLELYGTFHAMGVIVTLDSGDDPDGDATASVEYRPSGSGAYRTGFPLSRVEATRFAGSLFWLEPGTTYEVRVTLHDPDGGPLDTLSLTLSAATRPEISIPAANHRYVVSPSGSGTACCGLPVGFTTGIPGGM